ncbi:MAG: alpha/beta hydrolase, partial [Actinopolymorphaceae bacterium]
MTRTRRIVIATLATVTLATGAGPGPTADSAASAAALSAFPGAAAWHAAREAGLPIRAAATSSPAAVADFFDSLPLAEGGSLASRFPAIIGNLDGAPPALRYAANQKAAASLGGDRRPDLRGRQLLALDPRDRGLAVEVVGDLRTADRVAVIVPGAGSDLHTLDTPGGVAASARALKTEATRQEPGSNLAVVAWAGYPTPHQPDPSAMRGDLARVGAERLDRFLAGLAAYTPAPVGLFCHSYGSVVCGMTALPPQVSDIVVYGSPGVRRPTATGLSRTARVWAALAEGDPIRLLPSMRFGDFGHGPNPVDPVFGARV